MDNLKQGMTGSAIKEVQQKLIDAGYGDLLGKGQADGIFGAKTAAAVKKYQEDNGLTVDGIVGKNTLGALGSAASNKGNGLTSVGGAVGPVVQGAINGAGSNKGNEGGNADKESNKIVESDVGTKEPVAGTPKEETPTLVTSPAGFTYGDFYYDPFDPTADATIQQANDLLNQNLANKPGSYTPVWMDEADAYLSKYQNRDPFSYDFNSDALYQQYKDQYIQQGQLAMMDTMGQAAAMTGGYGNSYAQTVGQQAYNQQLGQLNEIMPELYNMAYNRYNQEGQDLLNMYDLYMNRESMAYNQYQDTLSNWYRENSLLTDNYNTAYNRAYDNYLLGYNTALGEYETDRSEEFSKWQATQSQEFTSSENEKDRQHQTSENEKNREESQKASAKKDLVNLITGTGYKPTDDELAAAGMTRSQADSYAKSYEQSMSTTNTNTTKTTETKYTVLDYEEQQKWEKSFMKAESIDDVDRIADRMEQAGVNPQVVADWRDYYAKQFKVEVEEAPKNKNATGVGGGVGAGVWYTAVK